MIIGNPIMVGGGNRLPVLSNFTYTGNWAWMNGEHTILGLFSSGTLHFAKDIHADVFLVGGGGGGRGSGSSAYGDPGFGGEGGGGDGAGAGIAGDGSPNSGGGGGGGGSSYASGKNTPGGSGGSGIVLIRVATE